MRRFVRLARSRPELVVFAVGFVLFAAGGMNLILSQMKATTVEGGESFSTPRGEPTPVLPERKPGESIDEYIARKTALLVSRASKQPREQGIAVVSFDEYLTRQGLDQFLKGRSLQVSIAFVRVPVEGFELRSVPLSSSTEPVEEERLVIVREVSRELAELRRIIPSVSDDDFKAVYAEDIRRYERALAEVETAEKLVYAVVVRGTYAALARAGSAPQVRLCDAGPALGTPPESLGGLLPEDK